MHQVLKLIAFSDLTAFICFLRNSDYFLLPCQNLLMYHKNKVHQTTGNTCIIRNQLNLQLFHVDYIFNLCVTFNRH